MAHYCLADSPDLPLCLVRFAETFRKSPFVLLGNALVPEPADIQPNSVEWRHLTRIQPYFQGSHEKSVVGPSNLGIPKDPAVLDKSPATAQSTWSISFLYHRYWNTKSSRASPVSGNKIQLSSIYDFSHSQGAS